MVALKTEIPAPAIILVKQFEGLSLVPYLCPAQIWTIGYGATKDLAGHKITARTAALTLADADNLLIRDLSTAMRWVERLIFVPLDAKQKSALISFVFNLGPTNFRSSTLRKRINEGDFDDVPNQLLRWVYGGGRKLVGLERRRIAEAYLWVEGEAF